MLITRGNSSREVRYLACFMYEYGDEYDDVLTL